MNELDLSYALAKKVPDMRRGFRIETNYGELDIGYEDAEPIARLVQRLLERRLHKLQAKRQVLEQAAQAQGQK